MLRSSVPEKSKLSIAFSKLYHSSAIKSTRLEKKREKWRFAAGDCGRAGSARRGRLLGRASCPPLRRLQGIILKSKRERQIAVRHAKNKKLPANHNLKEKSNIFRRRNSGERRHRQTAKRICRTILHTFPKKF